ncbi:AbgT putative transporter family protein [Staphylococcus arlettae]|nr:AbgT putative transporter family protein [Staphylococcus arlettae]RBA03444.1 AbgT putative transporter family protein [Staphylococcus arlettae]RBA07194.1 AbgT putative transporter family protein [Staphylococcus arlettae]
MKKQNKPKVSFVHKALNGVEVVGNRLPDPSILFFLMCVGLAVITWVVSLL